MEESGSAIPEEGWKGVPLELQGADGEVVGAIPFWLKGHSQGEFIFDHLFADFHQRNGVPYYPKGLVAIPFAPVPSVRLAGLVTPETPGQRPGLPPNAPPAPDGAAFAAALRKAADHFRLSSVHVNFCRQSEALALESQGFTLRNDLHFVWRNPGCRDFQDYLDTLRASRRKAIKRQRRRLRDQGFSLRLTTLAGAAEENPGGDPDQPGLDAFCRLYAATYDRKWGKPYLMPAFFRSMAGQPDLAPAFRFTWVLDPNQQPVGVAFSVRATDALLGRSWGSEGRHPDIHFEACYYGQLDQAIAEGIPEVQAGIQGAEQKLERGFEPELTWSAHWFREEALARPVRAYLKEEGRQVREFLDLLRARSPFAQAPTE